MSMTDSETVERIDPEDLRDAAQRLLADKVDRRGGWDAGRADNRAELLAEMTELGWLLLTAPAARGGLGQDFAALAPIYEESGRALAPVSVAATMAAVDLVAHDAEGSPGAALLDRILQGTARVSIGFVKPEQLSGATLSGEFHDVPDAVGATDLLLVPDSGEGDVLLVDLTGDGVTIEAVETWDRTRQLANVCLSGARAVAVGATNGGAAQLVLAHLDLAIAWDCIGGAQQALDEAIAYMGTRQQFNRPIGSFQALKHRSADLKVMLEIARALTREASVAYVDRRTGWADLAGQAKLLAADAYHAIAEESIQFHGGIGVTWEHDCHLFLKRAFLNDMLAGTPEQHRDRVAPGVFARALEGRPAA